MIYRLALPVSSELQNKIALYLNKNKNGLYQLHIEETNEQSSEISLLLDEIAKPIFDIEFVFEPGKPIHVEVPEQNNMTYFGVAPAQTKTILPVNYCDQPFDERNNQFFMQLLDAVMHMELETFSIWLNKFCEYAPAKDFVEKLTSQDSPTFALHNIKQTIISPLNQAAAVVLKDRKKIEFGFSPSFLCIVDKLYNLGSIDIRNNLLSICKVSVEKARKNLSYKSVLDTIWKNGHFKEDILTDAIILGEHQTIFILLQLGIIPDSHPKFNSISNISAGPKFWINDINKIHSPLEYVFLNYSPTYGKTEKLFIDKNLISLLFEYLDKEKLNTKQLVSILVKCADRDAQNSVDEFLSKFIFEFSTQKPAGFIEGSDDKIGYGINNQERRNQNLPFYPEMSLLNYAILLKYPLIALSLISRLAIGSKLIAREWDLVPRSLAKYMHIDFIPASNLAVIKKEAGILGAIISKDQTSLHELIQNVFIACGMRHFIELESILSLPKNVAPKDIARHIIESHYENPLYIAIDNADSNIAWRLCKYMPELVSYRGSRQISPLEYAVKTETEGNQFNREVTRTISDAIHADTQKELSSKVSNPYIEDGDKRRKLTQSQL